jgi:hypothetical protein
MRKATVLKQQISLFGDSEFRDKTHRCNAHRSLFVFPALQPIVVVFSQPGSGL